MLECAFEFYCKDGEQDEKSGRSRHDTTTNGSCRRSSSHRNRVTGEKRAVWSERQWCFAFFFFRRNKSWLFAIVQKRSLQLVKRRWNDTAAPRIDSVAPSGTYMEGRWHVTGDVMAWWWLGTGRVVFTCVIFVIFECGFFRVVKMANYLRILILPSPWCFIVIFILHRGLQKQVSFFDPI